MRRLSLTPCGLWLACSLLGACTPKPSAVPLGGEEWIPPERHVDRKPQGSSPEVDRAAQAPPPPKVAVEPVPAPQKTAPVSAAASASAVRFQYAPFARGNTVVIESRYAVRATVKVTMPGMQGDQSADVDIVRRIEVTVVDATPEQVRAVDVAYVESTTKFRMPGVSEDEDSRAGDRFRVSFGGSTPVVNAVTGTASADQVKQVLFDLATVTGYQPLITAHLPATLEPGWNVRIGAGELGSLFGSVEPVRLQSASLALRAGSTGSQQSVTFDCAAPIEFRHEGLRLTADLRGSCTADPRTSRPGTVRLDGPLRATETQLLGEGGSLSGTLEVRLQHTYRQ